MGLPVAALLQARTGRVLRPLRRRHLPDLQLAAFDLFIDELKLLTALLLGAFPLGAHGTCLCRLQAE
jgi:hypothetical protein